MYSASLRTLEWFVFSERVLAENARPLFLRRLADIDGNTVESSICNIFSVCPDILGERWYIKISSFQDILAKEDNMLL